VTLQLLRQKYLALAPALNERSRRLWAAIEAKSIGHGGISIVERAVAISHSTISRGMKELKSGQKPMDAEHIRRPGGGRKNAATQDPTLKKDLEALVEPTLAGDPQSPLRWTSKSLRKLSTELQAMGHKASHQTVAALLMEAQYSLQANRKSVEEGKRHPDRDAQFRYINEQVLKFQRIHQPVISVDTKKKEIIGDFKNAGKEWRPKGTPERVRVHDFLIEENGKAAPYGVYDITRNAGWVSVGIDHDTASFAVSTIRRWWQGMGRRVYPQAKKLFITADSGGSNGARLRLWKWELQKFADETGQSITVCHFPPGTSKWNKIEHRLFSYITMNWRGRPLTSLVTIVSLIASTRTKKGLRVRCEIDKGRYPKGIEISDEQMTTINLHRHSFHGDWNYTIRPTKK
jgi:hypothetical protein